MTLDVLVCTLDKGVVRVGDILLPQVPNVHYIISFQYTDERYLDLIPEVLAERSDVKLIKMKGQGLSVNRNRALSEATSELVLFADDDARFAPETFPVIFGTFEQNEDIDIAFFQASTYTGRQLKDYPEKSFDYKGYMPDFSISAIETVCRREKVQTQIRFDERFGLGTRFLTCGEEQIWLEDAMRAGLKMRYFPIKIVETSTILKNRMIYVDAGVQRSRGAITYYMYGSRAWLISFSFAMRSASSGLCHFIPMIRHLAEGIRYMQRNNNK
ncbi:MAG: glycosyltransferase [Bacteroidaceae bacterium]